MTTLGKVTDLLSIPNLIKNDERYRMPQREKRDCSNQTSEENEDCEDGNSKIDDPEMIIDDEGEKDYVPDISDLSIDDEFENLKGPQKRDGVQTETDVEVDLNEGENVHLCRNDGVHLFRATVSGLDFGTMVHNHEILDHHARFVITH